MNRDEEMARACGIDGIPRLRFYSWRPWTLSLGYNQRDEEIDHDLLQRLGYGLVRRPTGGRAVFHAEELTYAVAMPSGGAGIHETYAKINKGLHRGLEMLGVHDLEFSRTQPDFRKHYAMEESASCFSASALSELTWNGRKLLGSAQRRYGTTLLQHGSLLLDEAHLQIIDLLYPHIEESRRDGLRARLAERTATLKHCLGTPLPPFETVAEALRQGFIEVFETDIILSTDIVAPVHGHIHNSPVQNADDSRNTLQHSKEHSQ